MRRYSGAYVLEINEVLMAGPRPRQTLPTGAGVTRGCPTSPPGCAVRGRSPSPPARAPAPLQLRHNLGHEVAEVGWLLPDFVRYLDAHDCPTVTIEAALAWVQPPATGTPTTVGPRRMTAARGFARYLSGIDA